MTRVPDLKEEAAVPPTPGGSSDLAAELRLAGSQTSHRDQLPGARLMGADLRGTDLAGLDLTGADLTGADLRECRLIGTCLSHAVLNGAQLSGAEFLGACLVGADLDNASARGAGFGGADLTGASLFEADLTSATFTKSVMARADLRKALLIDARLREADLSGAVFDRADLSGADLEASVLTGASFIEAKLGGAGLRNVVGYTKVGWIGVDIASTDFCGAYRVRRTIMDQNFLHEFREESGWNRVFYWVWWATSDCGRSMIRWSALTFVIAVTFAGLYSLVDIDLGPHPTPFSHMYFSIVTLTTLGYGDVLPSSMVAQILAMAEVVIGYLMLGGLISIMSAKMARRAD